MASRTSLVRVGAAVLGVSTALMIGALPAAADTGSSPSAQSDASGAVTGHVTGVARSVPVNMNYQGKEKHSEPADLFNFQIGDDPTNVVQTYCVGFSLSLSTTATMTQHPWNQYPDPSSPDPTSSFAKNNSKINWILHHSYPNAGVKLADLATAAGVPALTEDEALGATQAAIWSFSDGATLADDNDPVEIKLYQYLTGSANTGVSQSTLSISPKQLTGTAGKLIGPFTVDTNVTGLKLSKLPTGVSVVDANAKAIDASSLTDGSKFYLSVSSTATVTSTEFALSGSVEAGALFTGVNPRTGLPSQPLITASVSRIAAAASASWTQGSTTTAPTTPAAAGGTTPQSGGQQQLAYTGVSATGPIVLGILLVAAGGLFLLVQRRLKRAS
jgi:TQXA domain-containing protein